MQKCPSCCSYLREANGEALYKEGEAVLLPSRHLPEPLTCMVIESYLCGKCGVVCLVEHDHARTAPIPRLLLIPEARLAPIKTAVRTEKPSNTAEPGTCSRNQSSSECRCANPICGRKMATVK